MGCWRRTCLKRIRCRCPSKSMSPVTHFSFFFHILLLFVFSFLFFLETPFHCLKAADSALQDGTKRQVDAYLLRWLAYVISRYCSFKIGHAPFREQHSKEGRRFYGAREEEQRTAWQALMRRRQKNEEGRQKITQM